MKFNGARRRVCLATSNKEEAAVKARDLYISIQSRGWEATLLEPGTGPSFATMFW